jgi:iron complex transport system substrate-binding protein
MNPRGLGLVSAGRFLSFGRPFLDDRRCQLRSLRTLFLVIVPFVLLVGACGDSDSEGGSAPDDSVPAESSPTSAAGTDPSVTTAAPSSSSAAPTTAVQEEATFPVTIESASGPVTIEERPERIVSLSATATEMLFAIGAGDQVVAVDEFSNYPPEAPITDLSGLEPNLEAIVGYEPDLVVMSFDPGDAVAGLQAAGVPSLVQDGAATLDDTYTQIEQLGAATGHVGEAADLVRQMQADIEELAASVPERETPLSYYHELDDLLFSATSQTFTGEIYSLAGLVNVADEADADGSAGGYPQLSAEYLLAADPDLIFLADTKCCGQTAQTLAARPGFSELTAVSEDRVVELDEDIAQRWGPRVVDFLEAVVAAVSAVEVPTG